MPASRRNSAARGHSATPPADKSKKKSGRLCHEIPRPVRRGRAGGIGAALDRAAVSKPDRAHRRAVLGRQQHRCPGADSRRQAFADVEAAGDRREPARHRGNRERRQVGRRRLHADAHVERSSGRQCDQPRGEFRSGQGFRRRDAGVGGVGGVRGAARTAREQSQGVHRAGAEIAGQDELRLGGHRQHVLSRRRGLQAGRQRQSRARSLQGRTRSFEQHPAQRHTGLFRQHNVLARPDHVEEDQSAGSVGRQACAEFPRRSDRAGGGAAGLRL